MQLKNFVIAAFVSMTAVSAASNNSTSTTKTSKSKNGAALQNVNNAGVVGGLIAAAALLF